MSIVKSEGDKSEGKKAPRKAPTRKQAAPVSSATTTATPKVEAAPVVEPASVARVRKPVTVTSADREMVILDATREEIAQRAYELYVARGRRDGHSDADWVRAEQELHVERERARQALRGPASRSTTES